MSAEHLPDELSLPPREQLGPYLILGVGRDATAEEIEARWAQRLIWARKKQFPIPLADVNWAREVLGDAMKRMQADAGSLSADTHEHALKRLAERFGLSEQLGPTWEAIDVEPPPFDLTGEVRMPDPEEVKRAIVIPRVPTGVAAAAWLLDQFANAPLDPWTMVSLVAVPSTSESVVEPRDG
jgi:hypothetical protein